MYDVICIGGGLNYAAAVILAKAGKKVALIEKNLNHIGGTCLHNGCIPSKNLLHRAKIALESKEEVFSHKAKVNLKKLQLLTNKNLEKNTQAIKKQCEMAGIELIEAEAFIVDNGVEVNGEILETKNIIIATGSSPFIPQNIEYDKKHIITSDEALNFEDIPKEISVYGSGAIGLEMASLFAGFGSKVNLIIRNDLKFDEKINEKLKLMLNEIGINIMTNSTITKAYTKENKAIININNKEITTEYLIIATGRKPNINVVKTDKIKIEKGIYTDQFFRTTMPNVWAIGDCNAKQQLAHSARAQALNVVNQILGKTEELNLVNIPKFIYTLPLGYASVGEKSDKKAIFELSHLGISGSNYLDKNGVVILYTDKDNFITGADILAPNAEELIGIITTAITAEMDIELFKKVIFPHPTYSEAFDRVSRRIR